MKSRSLSLAGCRTHREAENRVRAWLEQIYDDQTRETTTEITLRAEEDGIDDWDSVVGALDQAESDKTAAIDGAVAQFRKCLRAALRERDVDRALPRDTP